MVRIVAATTRAAGLRGFAELAQELGGDGLALLARFDITPEAVASEDAMISADAAGWVLEAAATELDCPDIGLRLAARQNGGAFGPLAVAVANAPTIGAGIETAARFLFVHHTGLALGLVADPEQRPGMVGLRYRDRAEATSICQGIDHGAGTIHRFLLRMAGGNYGLQEVHLPHPALAPTARYTAYFGAPVRFDMPTTVFRFPADTLARAIPDSDSVLYTIAMDYLNRNSAQLDQSMSARVRVAIDNAITKAPTDIQAIARTLSVHERSLQRALAAEGTRFSEILDEARRDVVQLLLRETSLPLGEVAAMVGFREQSALTKAARRWFGTAPTQVRNAARVQRGGSPPVLVRPPALH
ncbi:AraC family transcriptional regulator [Nocardia acididurans]|uniref:AraC family transcriptional regulator n=1 Tax=Nocardia acididurans TaxID=2802282 RepID=UPI0027DD79F5|nr:AraC family transcriptional regulator [Nocardia acididurans]